MQKLEVANSILNLLDASDLPDHFWPILLFSSPGLRVSPPNHLSGMRSFLYHHLHPDTHSEPFSQTKYPTHTLCTSPVESGAIFAWPSLSAKPGSAERRAIENLELVVLITY